MKWHSNLREGLIKSGSNKSSYDQNWGRFVPSKRLNVDKVPLPFAINDITHIRSPDTQRRKTTSSCVGKSTCIWFG